MRPIDADALKASIEEKDRYNLGGEHRIVVCGMLDDAPTIDVAPAVESHIKELEEENEALKLLVEWAEECDFGYDNFPEEYERYKDEIEGMGYIEGMIHIAKRVYQQKSRTDGDADDA